MAKYHNFGSCNDYADCVPIFLNLPERPPAFSLNALLKGEADLLFLHIDHPLVH
ncbi:hypothetical protein BOVA604_924 [Bacteroides ovatus]|nr:hypothetical protein BOVA604_924 [Bacteroides ovatus]